MSAAKRFLALLVCMATVTALFACGEKKRSDGADVNTASLLAELVPLAAVQGETYCSEGYAGAYEFDDDILAGKYGDLFSESPETASLVKYCAFFADETYGPEFGVFLFDTEENAAAMKKYIENRFADLIRNAVNYPSVDTTLAKNMVLVCDGRWVCYCALSDNGAFGRIFDKYTLS